MDTAVIVGTIVSLGNVVVMGTTVTVTPMLVEGTLVILGTFRHRHHSYCGQCCHRGPYDNCGSPQHVHLVQFNHLGHCGHCRHLITALC